ncbi:NfeD family protein [Allopontixanthobacter sediminis]|uniref:NfeD family protein n=1 Tax=Allopontixanthobacter sediminis TaxID=1689985 RepID=A0A845B2M0_9SPHN|nr:NfeD family protein [Allopontixanthobacter sediminis]MXP44835.1 NfeD family protein [Allopontixanthobacter sediminis]
MDDLGSLDPHWIWLSIGLVLAALEMVVPGVYLIWLALAALTTGVLTFVLDLGVAVQVTNFIFLSLIAVVSAKRWLRDRPITSVDPLMNDRQGRMIGQSAVVTVAIEGGAGRVRYGDSEWAARGPDLAVGVRVRITGADGTRLVVEPAPLLDQVKPADEPGIGPEPT